MKDIEELTQKYLKKILHYDSLSGIFVWLERPVEMFSHCKNPQHRWNSRFANKEAGSIWTSKKQKTSYIQISITLNGKIKRYLAHRLVFLYLDGHFPLEQVDHIDGNGLNNKESNLRKVSQQENHKNYPMQKSNTSGCTGVGWDKDRQKWRVRINVNGNYINGGLFTNIDEAIAKRKQLEVKYDFHKNHGRKQGE